MHAKRRTLTSVLSAVAVLAVVAALLLAVLPDDDKKMLTASFPRTVSLYEGSDVRILGVPVGTVESVTPTGTDVTVTMSYDAKHKVPADAQAVIVSPAIVGDRFVQLTPVYTGGDVLEDGADRCRIRLEVDFRSPLSYGDRARIAVRRRSGSAVTSNTTAPRSLSGPPARNWNDWVR